VIISIIFLLILVSLIALNIQVHHLIKLQRNDFSEEDAQVQAMTEQVADATGRLPKQEE